MKATYKRKLLIAIILLFITGCSTTQVLVVKPELLHFDTPETSGEILSGSIDAHISAATPKYEFGKASISDFLGSTTTTTDTSEHVKSSTYYDLGVSLGILERVDIFTRTRGMTGIKVQILGTSRQKREEGWKLAVSGATGNYSYVQTDDELLIFGSYDPVGLSVKGESNDFSINTGYRFNPRFLVYANLFKNYTNVIGSFSTNTVALSKSRTHDAQGILLGFNLIKESKSTFFTFEVGYVQSTWSTLGTKAYTPAGASIGYMW